MSVTTISGSIGLRAGDGRVGHNFSTNKSSVTATHTSITSSSTAIAAMPASVAMTNSSTSVTNDGKNNNSSPNGIQLKTNTANVPTITVSASDSPLPKAYGKIVLTLENVLIPEDKISPTPSLLDGLDPESEIDLRIMGCELIVSSGTLLKLPQTAMATGQVLFQRFYYSKSFVRQPMETTAMACVYLASKIEEAPRRIRDVINVFHHIKQVRSGKLIQPMILDPAYIRLKSDVTLAERRVLKELGFCVHVKHPHKLIVIYMQQLGYDKDSRFVQKSWNYMNDALRSNVFVRYTPEAIACACIFLSARVLKILLPASPAWYLVFDVTESQIMDICENILLLYERPKVQYDQLEKKVELLMKSYQDSRQKSKSGPVASIVDKALLGATNTPSPSSRPNSPSSAPQSTSAASVVKSKDSNDTDKRRRYDDKSQDGRRSAANSPPPKKSRRSPSPIVYTPPRHKHKKRKKSRHSHSESSSPPRSRERRSMKKHTRRERSRSPYYSSRRHHKKSKSHHR